MPRQAPIDTPGALHYVMCRGIHRLTIFRENQDRRNFVDRLGRVLPETSTNFFAWCLMPNHYGSYRHSGRKTVGACAVDGKQGDTKR